MPKFRVTIDRWVSASQRAVVEVEAEDRNDAVDAAKWQTVKVLDSDTQDTEVVEL